MSKIEPRDGERDAVQVVRRSVRVAVLAVLVAGGLATAPAGAQAACLAPSGASAIAAENANPGTPQNQWDIQGAGSASIQGFATDISVNCGDTVHFKIDTTASSYRLDIYRMGWYGGDGARFIRTVNPTSVGGQPTCPTDQETGRTHCDGWTESASWTVPDTALSGIYFAHVVANTGADSHIVFVVRNDGSHSNLYLQTADTTWQAYNRYGGNSLYTGTSDVAPDRAVKVSYDRPFTTRDYAPEDWVFNAEYPMVRWLERNGYDVSYSTGVDTDRYPALIQHHKTFLSVGHDEYWSGTQRANVEAARDAGVNLAFFSGNEVFWKTRWDDNRRTLVTYKETHGDAVDPTSEWTGTWRDPRPFNPQGGRPENSLTGTIFTVNSGTTTLQVPAEDGRLRLWRGTPVASQSAGQTMSLGADTIGYEWDEDLDNGARPAGLVELSSTTASDVQKLQDYGSTYGSGSATHHVTLYRDTNGGGPDALVFGAGTVQWSWGLDNQHDRGSPPANTSMQQATVNLLADMGAQPATLQAGLSAASASTDGVAPSSSITAPADGTRVPPGTTQIQGTAADAPGGRVGGVEVSVDGGATWHPAVGRESWRYAWTPSAAGPATLMTRAVDDSGNLGAPTSVTVGVGPRGCPCNLFGNAPIGTTDDDGVEIEVGVRFHADEDGFVTGLRYYRGPGWTGTPVGHLWSAGGALLGQATFASDSQPGWHEAPLSSPVPVSAGTTYVASYFSGGHSYTADNGFFDAGFDAAPLHAAAGSNGVYAYGGGFPGDASPTHANYGADAVFVRSDQSAPGVTSVTPADGAVAVDPNTAVKAGFDEPLDPSTVAAASFRLQDEAGTAVPAVVTYDAATRTAILRPAAPLAGLVTYRATLKGGLAGVGDVAGNPLAQDRTWSFTTAVGPTGSPVGEAVSGGHGSGTKGAASGAHGSTSKAALRVAVGPRSVRASGAGVVKLRVACPRSARSCRITLRLRLGRRNLATKTATVGGGHAKTLALKLSASARRDLRRRGSLAVTALAAVRDKAGHRATTATSIRLLAPRRR